jgi:hypothetical protein
LFDYLYDEYLSENLENLANLANISKNHKNTCKFYMFDLCIDDALYINNDIHKNQSRR